MNIMIYIPSLSRESGGIFQYSIALIKILATYKQNNYFVYAQNPLEEELSTLLELNNNLHLIPKKLTRESAFNYKTNRLKEELNKQTKVLGFNVNLKINYAYVKAIRKFKIDVLHCPYEVTLRGVSIPTISTIHDLQELHFPQYFSPDQRIERAIQKKNIVDHSNFIVCSYNHIKSDIEKFFPETLGKVHVCLLNMSKLWFSSFKKQDMVSLRKLNLPDEFILYPAATWEHKNHLKLIEAFHKVRSKNSTLCLVCTGKKSEFFFERIEPLIKELRLDSAVIFTGVVDDQVLYSLYNQTKAVVIPTLYEAGSFPLMESMMMEVPVICSNVTSLPETIGSEDFLFDPLDQNHISKLIFQILHDEDFKKRNIENSRLKASKLSETLSVSTLNMLYSELLKKG